MSSRFPKRHGKAAVARFQAATSSPQRRLTLIRKMLAAQKREREAIVGEFVKVRGLMPLLMKKRNGAVWSRAERIELQQQLRALAHISPYLVILVLPGSFAILPVLAWWLDRRRQHRDDPAPGHPV